MIDGSKQRIIKPKSGFTIVELLIVIVVIGILAAITIIAYNGVQQKARLTQYTTDSVTIVKKMETYNSAVGTYPLTASGSVDTAASTPQTAAGIALTALLNGQNESKLPPSLSVFAVLTAAAAAPTYAQASAANNLSATTNSYFVRWCTTGGGTYIYYPDPTTSTVLTKTAGVCP